MFGEPLLLQAARLADYSSEHTDGTFKLILLLGCVNALACMPLEPPSCCCEQALFMSNASNLC